MASERSEHGDAQSTTEKGNRHEREAKNILNRIYGAGIEKVDTFTNHDPFGFVDLIGIHPDHPVKFVQVKTNEFTTADKRKYKQRTRNLPPDHATFEVWVRIDRTGWDIYTFDGETFEKAAEMHTCDTDEAREKYAKLVENGVLA
jgi:hypothetical protein